MEQWYIIQTVIRNYLNTLILNCYGSWNNNTIIEIVKNTTNTFKTVIQNNFITFIIYYNESKHATLKSLGTVGGIYRVKAVRQVGGFDRLIKGAAEDRDLTARMRGVGWLLSISQAKLYHIYKENWNGLWNKYSWWGYGDHYLNRKHKGLVIIWQKMPLVTFMTGLRCAFSIYRKTHQKISFLMPFYNYFRSIAWCSGFIKSHMNGYGHEFHIIRSKGNNCAVLP